MICATSKPEEIDESLRVLHETTFNPTAITGRRQIICSPSHSTITVSMTRSLLLSGALEGFSGLGSDSSVSGNSGGPLSMPCQPGAFSHYAQLIEAIYVSRL